MQQRLGNKSNVQHIDGGCGRTNVCLSGCTRCIYLHIQFIYIYSYVRCAWLWQKNSLSQKRMRQWLQCCSNSRPSSSMPESTLDTPQAQHYLFISSADMHVCERVCVCVWCMASPSIEVDPQTTIWLSPITCIYSYAIEISPLYCRFFKVYSGPK